MLGQTDFGRALWSVALVFGGFATSACSDSYVAEPEVIPPMGATGAVGGTAGRTAGRAGSSVPRGGSDAPPPPPTGGFSSAGRGSRAGSGWVDPGFRVWLDGANVMLAAPANVYFTTCSGAVVLQKLTRSGWTAPTDDRPPSYNNPGYYLDGRYVAPSFNEGCDVLTCQGIGSRYVVAKAAEYVQTGSVQTTNGGMPIFVPSIETRPLSGAMQVRVTYSRDPSCQGTEQAVLEFVIPEFGGVCCQIGNEGCGTMGPGGGWALDNGSCRDLLPANDVYYRRVFDAHGCPYLIEDLSQCCGCEDAGVAFEG